MHSHLRTTESNPHAEARYRVIIPLASSIPAGRFFSLWMYVKNSTGLLVDESAKDESRIFYIPAIAHEGAEYECYIQEGSFLDWESLPLHPVSRSEPTRRTDPTSEPVPAIANGSRNQGLFKNGKRLVESGIALTAVRAALLAENVEKCRPPLSAAEVESIAANVMVYPLGARDDRDYESAHPIELPTDDTAVPELSHELLPSAWREWLSDVSDRLQCPLDYAAVAAMVSTASLIGNRIRIRPKHNDSWLVVPNLWGAIVGPPGVMKTPAVNEGLIFFRSIADDERRRYEEELKDADFENEFNEAKRSELVKEMKKARPESKSDLRMRYEALADVVAIEKRLWTADSTIEKLGVLLNENPDGILILRVNRVA